RFERGVDGGNIRNALYRCLDLIRTTDSNQSLTIHEPVKTSVQESFTETIDFNRSKFETLIGYERAPSEMKRRLQGIGCTISNEKNGTWSITTPSWRHDLQRQEDLIEEIVRLDGYESIQSEFPTLSINQTPPSEHRDAHRLRTLLTGWGFHETTTFSFLPEDSHNFRNETSPHTIENPLSQEQATMRQTLLDSMISPLVRNLEAGRERINLFEIGKVFPAGNQEELRKLGLITTGEFFAESWDDHNRPFDFYDLKGLTNLILTKLGWQDPDIIPENKPGLLEGRSAEISVNDRTSGHLGQIDPDIISADSDHPVWGCELNLTALGESDPVKYNPFSKQPAVKRDLDLVIDKDQHARNLKQTIRNHAEWLESIEIFDLYRGEPLPDDKKSISFRLHFRNPERTLNDQEVNTVQENILDALRDQYGAYLRDE
ncbi:MAG: phenylalanine--tRNA ligase subunit beta, partial [bacterium]